jgi:hypothetical protein
MSSATSTDPVRVKADEVPGLQPWQFFVLAALVCATAVTYLVRGQGVTVVLLLSVLMATTVLIGLAVLRTVRPLVTQHEERLPMVGGRTRAALEREKMLALRTLKELEFDRAMKKISEDDYREMSARLRSRAARLINQLDAGSGYRSKIEADLARRIAERDEPRKAEGKPSARACAACTTLNEADAKFCKQCGEKL